jgi:hypothetical protein
MQLIEINACFRSRLGCRSHDGDECPRKVLVDIGGSSLRLTHYPAFGVANPRPAAAAASIDAEKISGYRIHARVPQTTKSSPGR